MIVHVYMKITLFQEDNIFGVREFACKISGSGTFFHQLSVTGLRMN